MTVGERVRYRRLELGLSVIELAEKLNVNRTTIYRYESNEIEKLPINVLEPLAEALNVSPAYLIGWEDVNSSDKEKSVPVEINRNALTELLMQLTEEEIDKLIDYAKYLLSKR